MYTKAEVEERARRAISEQLATTFDETISSARLGADLGADSLDSVEVVMRMEEEFRLEISDEDAERFLNDSSAGTVGDIVKYLCEKLGAK